MNDAPCSAGHLRKKSLVDLKDVLVANLQALSNARWGRPNKRRLAEESGVSLGTAQRVYDGQTSVGIDTLQKLGDLFCVDAGRLLMPNLGTGPELSEMARGLALALDQIEDTTVRRRVWALCMLVIAYRDLPEPTADPFSPSRPEHLSDRKSQI